jgi:hypothetical protein
MKENMLKKISKTLAIMSLILMAACTHQTSVNHGVLKSLFQRWDEGKIGESEKNNNINILHDFLTKNPNISTDELNALSPFITIYEIDRFRMVEYIENPEYYGLSGRESFHLTLADGKSNIIDSRGSMRIEDIRKTGEHVYTLFATDYKVSTVSGIKIFNLELDDDEVRKTSLIKKEHLPETFYYDEASEVLYYKNGHIFFKDISDHGDTVVIDTGDSEYRMTLVQDEYGQLSMKIY